MEKSDTKLLLSSPETARLLGISEKMLWNVTSPRGELCCVRIGRRVLFDPSDVQDWINKRKA